VHCTAKWMAAYHVVTGVTFFVVLIMLCKLKR